MVFLEGSGGEQFPPVDLLVPAGSIDVNKPYIGLQGRRVDVDTQKSQPH